MFPIKIDTARRRFPLVTCILIIICSVIHFYRPAIFPSPGLIPLDMVHSILHPDKELATRFTALLTAFFIHGSLLHLAGNCWYLWLFGTALENFLATGKYIFLYFAFGVISMVVQIFDNPLSSIPIVGASGAIAGIMGMYLVLDPFSRMVFWFPPIFFFRIPSFLFLLFWFWLQWRNSASSDMQGALIAWWAHIGGFIAGVVAAIYMRITGSVAGIRTGVDNARYRRTNHRFILRKGRRNE